MAKKTTPKKAGKSKSKAADTNFPSGTAPAAASDVIHVPKPARASFNPGRLVAKNTLITNQIEHFHKLELQLPPEQRTDVDFEKIETEGEASEYVRKMTAILHPQIAKMGGK